MSASRRCAFHKGNIQDDIVEGVYTVAEDFLRLIDASAHMKETQLSEPEQRLSAEVSLPMLHPACCHR